MYRYLSKYPLAAEMNITKKSWRAWDNTKHNLGRNDSFMKRAENMKLYVCNGRKSAKHLVIAWYKFPPQSYIISVVIEQLPERGQEWLCRLILREPDHVFFMCFLTQLTDTPLKRVWTIRNAAFSLLVYWRL